MKNMTVRKLNLRFIAAVVCSALFFVFTTVGGLFGFVSSFSQTITAYAAETKANEYGFAGGDGSENNPFLIGTPAHLDNVRNFASNILDIGSGYPYRSYHFRVICDIDMADYLAAKGAGYAQWGIDGWLPIEKEGVFNGVFDGGYYTIKNLWSYRPDDGHVGLFGYCEDGVIKNIRLELSGKGITGFAFVGGIAAELYNRNTGVEGARITGCSVTGSVSAASGQNDWPVMAHAGGIVGQITNGAVRECAFSGNVSGLCAVGGIAGVNTRGEISNCLSYGKVILTSTEDFISEAGAGGIVGITMDNETIIKNCFYEAPQTDSRVAGIVGFRTTVYRKSDYCGLPLVSGCYYNGSVFSGSLTLIEDIVEYKDSYYDEEAEEDVFFDVSEPFVPQNSGALTAKQMKNKASYKRWDFEDIWGFDKDGNLVLRTFGNAYDRPSLAWLWILFGCTIFGAAAVASGLILYRRKKTEIIKETVSVDNYIEIVKEVPAIKKPLPEDLSKRERQVAELLLQGKSRREIADIIDLADNTVGTYITRVCTKAGVDSIREFVVQHSGKTE